MDKGNRNFIFGSIRTLHLTIQFDDPIFIFWIEFRLSIDVLNRNEFLFLFLYVMKMNRMDLHKEIC